MVEDMKGSTLIATIPALRANMNCTGIPHTSLEIKTNMKTVPPTQNIRSKPLSERGCPHDRVIPDMTSSLAHYKDAYVFSQQVVDNCPAFLFMFGFMHAWNNSHSAPVTTFNMAECYPYIEQIDVSTTFLRQDFTIDTTEPPRPVWNSSRVKFASISATNGTKYPIIREGFEYHYLPILDNVNDVSVPLKGISDAMIYSRNGVPARDLIQNDDGATLAGELERVIGITMAQLLGAYGRSSDATISSFPEHLPTFNATISSPGRLRLVQSRISTRILQGLLGALAVCAIVTLLTLKTKKVLPKNPCSIAGLASLLTGSEFLRSIPPGAEWDDEHQLRRAFDGWLFSMGWWEVDGKYRYGIDIGQHPARNLEDLTRLDRSDSVQLDDKAGQSSVAVDEDPTLETVSDSADNTLGGTVRRMSLDRSRMA